MRQPTIVNQPPTNLLLQPVEDDDQAASHLGEIMALIPRFSSEYLARLNRGDVPTNKLDIIIDEHIYDLHFAAQQHGCTPSDVAISERTEPASKPLSPSKLRKNFCPDCDRLSKGTVQYVTQDHSGLTCEQYIDSFKAKNTKRVATEQRKRDESCVAVKAHRAQALKAEWLARESEWQRELATWPPFVPRNPINPSQVVVVRDLAPVNSTPPLKPSLAAVLPRSCFFHDRMRKFTFKDRTTIEMCPDCTTFDKQRINILKTGKLAEAKMQHAKQRWEERLEAEGLPAEPPDNPIVLSRKQLRKDLAAIEHAQAAEEKASPAKSDYRASQNRKQVKTHTYAQRNCQRCGTLFVPHHGHQKYCGDCNPKQYYKEKEKE